MFVWWMEEGKGDREGDKSVEGKIKLGCGGGKRGSGGCMGSTCGDIGEMWEVLWVRCGRIWSGA